MMLKDLLPSHNKLYNDLFNNDLLNWLKCHFLQNECEIPSAKSNDYNSSQK